MEMINKKIKPCPFCGGVAEYVSSIWPNSYGDERVCITCTSCEIYSPEFSGKTNSAAKRKALTYWNQRAK